jgi:hypothetical protein
VEDLDSSHGTYLIGKDVPDSLIATAAGERCESGTKVKVRSGESLRLGAKVTCGPGKNFPTYASLLNTCPNFNYRYILPTHLSTAHHKITQATFNSSTPP